MMRRTKMTSISIANRHILLVACIMLLLCFCTIDVSFASGGVVRINESEDINAEFDAASFSFGYNDYIGLSGGGKRICGYSKAFTLDEDSDVRVFCETSSNSFGQISAAIGTGGSYFREYQLAKPDSNGIYHLKKGDYYLFLYRVIESSYHYCYGQAYVTTVRNHSYEDWVITSPACLQDGTRVKTCVNCGKMITEIIPVSGHEWGQDYVVDIDSSCTAEGVESLHCIYCGAVKESSKRAIALKDHSWNSSYSVDIAATCSSEGSESIHCHDCNEIKSGSERSIVVKDHSFGAWETTTAATCTKAGIKTKTCATCNAKQTSSIAATGHSWSTWKQSKAATVFAKGAQKRTCNKCGKAETTSVKKVVPFAKFKKATYSVKTKKSLKMKSYLKMGKGDYVKSWKVNKNKYASISKGGVLKAKKTGTVVVTAKLASGKKATCKVKITKPAKKKQAKKKSSGGTVYWTPSGSVYHKSSGCRTLKRSKTVYSGTISESGKSRACKVCGN